MPETDHDTKSVLRRTVPEREYQNSISRLAATLAYVESDCKIGDLANEWRHAADLSAIAVTDKTKHVLGIILRESLFDILGKPYGWDVMKNRTVDHVMETFRAFLSSDHILSVTSELGDQITGGEQKFYVITNFDGIYQGIFHTRDLLVYLSGLTRKDLVHARRIQQNLVAENSESESPGYFIAAASRMAREVGGDYYLMRRYASDRTVVILADVCGKGISASFVAAVLGGMAEVYDFRAGIAPFLHLVGGYLARMDEFVTGIVLDLREDENRILAADMGHSFLYLHRDSFSKIDSGRRNPPIGLYPEREPTLFEIIPEPGDILYIVSDGAMEQEDTEGNVFPVSTLSELKISAGPEPQALRTEFISRFEDFRGREPQSDDMTFLAIRKK